MILYEKLNTDGRDFRESHFINQGVNPLYLILVRYAGWWNGFFIWL